MLRFTCGMDEHSLDIMRGDVHIGYLQWHFGRHPRVVLIKDFGELALYELQQCVAELEKQTKG